MLRSQLRVPRLHRSLHTTRAVRADAPQKAAAQVSNTASKAASSAQEYAGKALEQSQKFAQAIGNTTGKLLSNAGPRVNGLVDRVVGLQKPFVYWGKVTGEVAKQGTYSILLDYRLCGATELIDSVFEGGNVASVGGPVLRDLECCEKRTQ